MADVFAVAASARTLLLAEDDRGTARSLRQQVARIAAILPPATAESFVAFAFEHDRTAFLAALMATWGTGHGAALAHDARRASIGPVLARDEVCLLVHDTGAGSGLDVPAMLARPAHAAPPPAQDLALAGPFASHDGGRIRRWSAAAMAALVRTTAARLHLPAGALVWNAFRPASPAALIPGLLAPLHANCTVAGTAGLAASAVAAQLAAQSVHTVVAPAALLRTLARAHPDALRSVRQAVAADEPLDPTTVRSLAGICHVVPDLHGLIAATPPDPRATALQHAALTLEGVHDAAVEVVDLPDGLRAFCALAAGSDRTATLQGHLPANAALRVADALPRDPDGAFPRAVLLRWFLRDETGLPPCTTLACHPHRSDDGTFVLRTTLPANHFAFAGHFTGYPVLSGAVQLHELVLPCVRTALGSERRVAAFHDLKFLARIGPDDTVDVTVRVQSSGDSAEFEITRGKTKCSTGRVVLAPRPAEPSR